MSAEFLAALWVALEDARIACIAAQNKNDMSAIKQTNKSWSKIRRAIEKVCILRKEQAEEERFQLALKLALEARKNENESMRSLGITISEAQAERIAEEDEEFEPQTQSCYRCGGFYCHETKEAYDEDTGYCPRCV